MVLIKACPVPQPGAVDVFLDFISYSGGPLPEELLPQTTCPVSILWGEADPWEPIELGRAYGEFDCVEEFIPLPGALYIRSAAISVCTAATQLRRPSFFSHHSCSVTC